MQVGMEKTDSLKVYLRRLNIIGISNEAKGIKEEAVATRMLQLGVTVAEAYAAYKGLFQGRRTSTTIWLRSKPVIPGTRFLRERSVSR
jgi:hypothetical protein